MKRVLSLLLSLVMAFSIIAGMDVSVFAASVNEELVDRDIYKAQCLLGIAEDSKSGTDALERCNAKYKQYMEEEVLSPTRSFLDSVYADDVLMAEFALWQVQNLGSNPSSIVESPLKKIDYYESLIVAIIFKDYDEINGESEKDPLKLDAEKRKIAITDGLCSSFDIISDHALLDKIPNISSAEALKIFDKVYNSIPELGPCDIMDQILNAANNVYDAIERLAVYSTMVSLDKYTKQWLDDMYSSCDSDTPEELRQALKNLKNSSHSFESAIVTDVCSTGFRLATWTASTTLNTVLALTVQSNPLASALLAGLKIGNTISDILFGSDEMFEQFFLMECIYNIQLVSKKVVLNTKNTFLGSQTNGNAKSFLYAVDFCFEAIINADTECMSNFLNILYNGGIIKGKIKWKYGTTDDYQEVISALENLRSVRIDNYRFMVKCYELLLMCNHRATYDKFIQEREVVPVEDISFKLSRMLPPAYPLGYADMIVGDFSNISVNYVPEDTTQKTYIVTSDNPEIVDVNDNILTAVAVGTANITITAAEAPTLSYTAQIKVGEKLNDLEYEGITNRFTYTIDENGETTFTGLVDGYEPENFTIPSQIMGYPVTSVGEKAFRNCEKLKSVTIPYGVTNIGDEAFYSCANLASINIPDNTKTIGDNAFFNCLNLKKLKIGNGVTRIGASAFSSCRSLESILIPGSVTYIGDFAFCFCDELSSITIPKSVTNLGKNAFGNCPSLIAINVDEENDKYSSLDGVLYNKNRTNLIRYPENKESDNCFIPNTVKVINEWAFDNCNKLISIEIPDSVTRIECFSFYDCTKLVSISIPDSVTFIDVSAFDNTGYYNDENNWENDVLYVNNHLIDSRKSLSGIYEIKQRTKTISPSAFCDCDELTMVTIPNTITRIEQNTFMGCENLSSVVIPNSVISIGRAAFSHCDNLTSVTIPDTVQSMGDYIFSGCSKLESITIPENVTSMGVGAFRDCESLKTAILSKNIVSISDDMFENCTSITSFIIPDGIENIGEGAFEGCSHLKEITIPTSIKYVEDYAFHRCMNLTDVYYLGSASQWGNRTLFHGLGNESPVDVSIHFAIIDNPPTTPKLKSVSNTTSGVKVAWNAVEGADEYIVYRKTSKSGWANLGTTTEASFTDKTAKSGTTYYYTVKAQNSVGTSAYNKTGLAIKYLAAPKLSKVYNNGAGNVLSWGKVTGASGYYVYRKTPSSGWSKVATIKKGTTASYTDKKVTYGKTYIYTVKAYSGKTTSSFNTNGVTILKKIPNVTITTKNVNGGKRVSLSSSISGATIYYKTSKDGKYKKYTGEFGLTSTKTIYAYAVRSGYYKSSTASKKITVTKVKTPSVVVKNCVGGKKISFTSGTAGATFYYKTSKNGSYVKYTEPFTLTSTKTIYVKAYKPGYATSSTASKKVSVSKIGTPTITSVKAYNDTGKVVLKWKAVSGAQGYYVYRADESNTSYELVATVKGGKIISYTDYNYADGLKNTYKVRAYCSGKATSSYSGAKSVYTEALDNSIMADPLAAYQKAAKAIHENGVAGYTNRYWHNLDDYNFSKGNAKTVFLTVLEMFMLPEEKSSNKLCLKESDDAKNCMPASNCSKEFVKSTTAKRDGNNYIITIVMKDQVNPFYSDSDGLAKMSNNLVDYSNIQDITTNNDTFNKVFREVDGSITYKEYTIVATMNAKGQFIKIQHYGMGDMNFDLKTMVGEDNMTGSISVHSIYTDFKY